MNNNVFWWVLLFFFYFALVSYGSFGKARWNVFSESKPYVRHNLEDVNNETSTSLC